MSATPHYCRGASLCVEKTPGRGLCVSGSFIVVKETQSGSVALYDAATLAFVGRFGTRGRDHGQFEFWDCYGGMCAGTGPGTTIFITDDGNGRVGEHALPDGSCVRYLGVSHVTHPANVDANARHVVVLERHGDLSYCRILLFGVAATDTTPPLWTFSGDGTSLPVRLDLLHGLHLSRDGKAVLVASYLAGCVLRIALGSQDGSGVVVVATAKTHGLDCPCDVLECEDGRLLVADLTKRYVTVISSDGTASRECMGVYYTALARLPGADRFIGAASDRLCVFHADRWKGDRRAWVTAMVCQTTGGGRRMRPPPYNLRRNARVPKITM